jgi:predicted transcriptional regulator of viral defense system
MSYDDVVAEAIDSWFSQALVVGSLLAPEGAAAYATAMRWWGLGPGAGSSGPGLIPIVFITPKRKQAMRPRLLGARFELVFIKPERMFGAALLGDPGLRIRVTERERTVIDMLDRSDLCGGIPAAAAALCEAWTNLDLERLTDYLERFAGGTVPRRLGYLVERLGLLPPDDPMLARWRALIGAGYSLLERGGPAVGPFLRRWHLRVNVPQLG